jgi:RsbT co-antagonist protein rsbRD N-terminal domain
MLLHDAMAACREAIIQTWQEWVRDTLVPESMPTIELRDHLPRFVEEIIVALRTLSESTPLPPIDAAGGTAAEHGAQRLRLGFKLDAVVREYGLLHDAILGSVLAIGYRPTLGELHVLHSYTIEGIARAVTEYSRQRDTELGRD